MYRRLSKEEKLELIKKVQSGGNVSKICKQAGISRTILYSWLKTRNQSLRKRRHWKKLPIKIEHTIIKTALKNPSFSPKAISQLTHVSQHGVWSVLKRNGLNTKQARDVYIHNNGRSLIRSLGVNDKIAMMRRLDVGEKYPLYAEILESHAIYSISG